MPDPRKFSRPPLTQADGRSRATVPARSDGDASEHRYPEKSSKASE